MCVCACVCDCESVPMASSKAKRTVFPWSKRFLALFPIHLNPVSVSCSNIDDKNHEANLKNVT